MKTLKLVCVIILLASIRLTAQLPPLENPKSSIYSPFKQKEINQINKIGFEYPAYTFDIPDANWNLQLALNADNAYQSAKIGRNIFGVLSGIGTIGLISYSRSLRSPNNSFLNVLSSFPYIILFSGITSTCSIVALSKSFKAEKYKKLRADHIANANFYCH